MSNRICIVGSGPTGIFTLKSLAQSPVPLSIAVYEAEQEAGKGTPYLPTGNDPVVLSNIASIEIPPLFDSLVGWLRRQPDEYLARFSILRSSINERQFYPRLVLGDYFHEQFEAIIDTARRRGHVVEIHTGCRVTDITLCPDQICVTASNTETTAALFDHVVMATGHNWPKDIEVSPGYFTSPWPAASLKGAGRGRLGILGTSLSAIDALLTVATSCGSFVYDAEGRLNFEPAADSKDFAAVMMSRKGLLPEADFYCPLPYDEPSFCTKAALDAEIAAGTTGLLDRVFDLFRQELLAADPDYASQIGLAQLTVDDFAEAYYNFRSWQDPFVWAAFNLAEAERNFETEFTVPWRYAILITHEIIASAVPHLDTTDLKRFNRSFKSVFIDDYATVPHLSIERLLALRNSGRLDVIGLGSDYEIETEGMARGARVKLGSRVETFDSFIDATGQSPLSARDLPFPTLIRQGGIRPAVTREPTNALNSDEEILVKMTGGIDVDERYRPRQIGLLSNRLYCVAIPFLLHKHPFVQGITSAAELGEIAARAILADIETESPATLLTA